MNIQVVQSKKSDGASEINLQMRHRFKLLLKVVDAKLRPAASSARAAFKRSLFGCRWLLARIDSLERASSNGFCVFVVDIWDHVCTVGKKILYIRASLQRNFWSTRIFPLLRGFPLGCIFNFSSKKNKYFNIPGYYTPLEFY